jgi:oligopeptide transport system substrate-binding protein
MNPCLEPVQRRVFLAGAAGAAFTTGCGTAGRNPGRLRYLLRRDILTLDPAKSAESWLLAALYEPLIQLHPETMAPMAGLVTHYCVDRDGTRYTFYLRGHRPPRAIKLPDAGSLPPEFSRGRAGAPDDVPARWSDGVPISAEDAVHSFRRFFAPETANADAYMFYCIEGAEAAAGGKIPPERIGVHALDRFTFQIDLHAPAPYLPILCGSAYLTPRHTIDDARRRGREASWTDAGRIVTSGPFQLKEHRPHERTLVSRNQYYFDAPFVGIEEIEFSSADGVVALNLFRAGLADSMEGRVLPLQLTPLMRGTPALHVRPALACHNWRIDTTHAPLDNVLLRYALNMATEKQATAEFLGMGQAPALSRVPPIPGYEFPARLLIEIAGRACDILAFNPQTARELWAANAGLDLRTPITIHYPARVDSRLLAEIQQSQLAQHLGLRTNLQAHEPAAYAQSMLGEGRFTGLAEDSYAANYPDPYDLLSLYATDYRNWSDGAYTAMLAAATCIPDPARRMKELAACEGALMLAMPFIPVYFDTWVYLERPEIRGLRLNRIGVPAFKYAWIESSRSLQ